MFELGVWGVGRSWVTIAASGLEVAIVCLTMLLPFALDADLVVSFAYDVKRLSRGYCATRNDKMQGGKMRP